VKNIFIVAIVLLLPLIGTSQIQTNNTEAIEEVKFRCIYTHFYQRDSTNKDDIRKEDMLLLIGKQCSRFISCNKLKCDSLIHDFEKRGMPPEVVLADISIFPRTNFNYQVFKNYPEGKLTFFDRVFKDKYKYDEEVNCLNWQIHTDTVSIAGMKCQKAITSYAGRDYIAWFTNEIPVNDGPYKFHGLPGLIVKVGDTKNHYVFELKSVSKAKSGELVFYPIHETITTTCEGLLKARQAANCNIIQRLEQMGGKITDPEQRKILSDKAKRKAKQRNNPMELM